MQIAPKLRPAQAVSRIFLQTLALIPLGNNRNIAIWHNKNEYVDDDSLGLIERTGPAQHLHTHAYPCVLQSYNAALKLACCIL
jgi:hypothetical protein